MAKSKSAIKPTPKSKLASKSFMHSLVARAETRYIIAFIMGCGAPLTTGFLAAAITSPLWYGLVQPTEGPVQFAVGLINTSTFALTCLLYLLGWLLLVWVYRRLGAPIALSVRAIGTGVMTATVCAMLAITLSVQISPMGHSATMALITTAMTLFGLGYVLGLWFSQRSTKFSRR